MLTSTHRPHGGDLRSRLAAIASRTLIISILILAGCYAARAQDPAPDPTPTPTAAELAMMEEIRLLKLKKERDELKKGIREAQPQPSTTPLEGKTEVDENVVLETQMVTYKAMSDVADRIGNDIHHKLGDGRRVSIAIYDGPELQNLKHYRATLPILAGRIGALESQYKAVISKIREKPQSPPPDTATMSVGSTTAPTAGVGAVTNGLLAFADLLALMRTDTEIKGKTVTVEEKAIVAETFRALRNRFLDKIQLYYPSVVPPEVYLKVCGPDESQKGAADNDQESCSKTLSRLAGLYAKKEQANEKLLENMFDVTFQFGKLTATKTQAEKTIEAISKQIGELKLERLKAELKTPWTRAKMDRFDKFIKELETRRQQAVRAHANAEVELYDLGTRKNLLEQLQSLNQQTDQLVSNLAKPDEKTGQSELANFLRAENIDNALGADGYWLEFKSIVAGGNNRTRKNLFRYFSGAKLDHSGGIVIEWTLYNRNGVSIDSNKDSSYGGYQTPKEIQSARFKDTVVDPSRKPAQDATIAKSGNQ